MPHRGNSALSATSGGGSADGSFPEYEKLIPAQFNTLVSFDTNEAVRAVSSLKVLSDSKAYPIDLSIGNGKIRLDGSYLADALRACGGMVELKLVNSTSPMLFTSPDYELVVMPMFAGASFVVSDDLACLSSPSRSRCDNQNGKVGKHDMSCAHCIYLPISATMILTLRMYACVEVCSW